MLFEVTRFVALLSPVGLKHSVDPADGCGEGTSNSKRGADQNGRGIGGDAVDAPLRGWSFGFGFTHNSNLISFLWEKTGLPPKAKQKAKHSVHKTTL